MYLEVNFIPEDAIPLLFQNMVMIIPARMAITAPPIIGNFFPKNQDGIAIIRHTRIPIILFRIALTVLFIYITSIIKYF